MTTSGQWRAKGAPGSCRTCRAKLGDAHASWCSGGAMLGIHPLHVAGVRAGDEACEACGYVCCACLTGRDLNAAPAPEQRAARAGWIAVTDGRFDGYEREDGRACASKCWFSGRIKAGAPNVPANGHYRWNEPPWSEQPEHADFAAAMAWADAKLFELVTP